LLFRKKILSYSGNILYQVVQQLSFFLSCRKVAWKIFSDFIAFNLTNFKAKVFNTDMKADINILGLFKVKTEDMKFWQLLTLTVIGIIAVLATFYMLKVYSIPLLGTQSVVSLIQLFKSRSP
jgi:hypothetical protein